MISNINEKLSKNKGILLTIEMIGWLHDIGKLDKERYHHHLYRNISDIGFGNISPYCNVLNLPSPLNFPQPLKEFLHQKISSLSLKEDNNISWLNEPKIHPPDIGSPIISHHKDGVTYNCGGQRISVPGTPPACIFDLIVDTADSIDSEIDRKSLGLDEDSDMIGITNPFGLWKKVDVDLTQKRQELYDCLNNILEEKRLTNFDLINKNISTLRTFLKDNLLAYLKLVSADTKLGINDVSLWDHCFMTGAIARILLSYAILNPSFVKKCSEIVEPGNDAAFNAFRNLIFGNKSFSLLAIKFYGLNYIMKSFRSVDFVGREVTLKEFIRRVKMLIEEELLLGVSIYEDLEGLYFLLPAFADLEEIEKDVINLILEQDFYIPVSTTLTKPIIGKDIPQILSDLIKLKDVPKPLTHKIKEAWQNASGREKCDICGQYPAEHISIRKERICESCMDIRKKATTRIESSEAAFIDECSDKEGRVCLVAGWFRNLPEWLSGKVIANTKRCQANKYRQLVSRGQKKEGDWVPKVISPSRSRAIWRTTEEWINEVLNFIKSTLQEKYRNDLQRFRIIFPINLPAYGFYEIIKPDFLKGDDIFYAEGKGGFTTQIYTKSAITEILKLTHIHFQDANGYNYPATITGTQVQELSYVPFFSILSNPRSFAFLIPAEDMVETVGKIEEKFKKDFILSMNEAGFDLFAIFFKRKYPLYFVFDSLKRFFDSVESFHYVSREPFILKAKLRVCDLNDSNKEKLFWKLKEKDFHVEKTHDSISVISSITWDGVAKPRTDAYGICKAFVPNENSIKYEGYLIKIGDDTYPVNIPFLSGTVTNEKIEQWVIKLIYQNIPFSLPIGKDSQCISCIIKNFDFEFLDSSARRFDIYYKEGKRNHPILGREKSPRPYRLESFNNFKRLWKFLLRLSEDGKLTDTKLHNIEALFATKFEEWRLAEKPKDSEEWSIWEKLIDTTLMKEFEWNKDSEDLKFVKESILSGLFFDCLELNLRIVKNKLKEA